MTSPHPAIYRRHKSCVVALVIIALPISTLPPALAAGDAASGRQLYQVRCVGCHGDGSNATALGPNLAGIVGRKAGTGESGVHSRALTESNIRWDEPSLRWFLAGPVEGTSTMPSSVLDPQQIEDLIAYLKTLR